MFEENLISQYVLKTNFESLTNEVNERALLSSFIQLEHSVQMSDKMIDKLEIISKQMTKKLEVLEAEKLKHSTLLKNMTSNSSEKIEEMDKILHDKFNAIDDRIAQIVEQRQKDYDYNQRRM